MKPSIWEKFEWISSENTSLTLKQQGYIIDMNFVNIETTRKYNWEYLKDIYRSVNPLQENDQHR